MDLGTTLICHASRLRVMARNRPSKLVVVQWTTCLVGSVGNILVLVVLAWRRRRPFQVKFGIHCRSRIPYWTQSKPSTDGTLSAKPLGLLRPSLLPDSALLYRGGGGAGVASI